MNAMTEVKYLHASNSADDIKSPKYRQLDVQYDSETRSAWVYMQSAGAPCFNLGLLQDFRNNDKSFERNSGKVLHNGELAPVDYNIIASKVDHVFNYGGDLALFVLLIKSRDREGLLHYAKLCIEGIYARIVNYNTSALTVSLVQGDALGGGFELALASNVIVAEETARMGLPEILFNLFPGMGAYSLLARRVGMKKAEEIILGGKIYEAGELHEMGIVDVLTPAGGGENAVYEYMHQNSRRLNGMRAMYECRQHTNPISYDELMKITEVWVDAALRLQERDLKMMGRLVRSQLRQQEIRKNAHSNYESAELAVGY